MFSGGTENFLDPTFQYPILVRLFRLVVEGASCDAKLSGPKSFGRLAGLPHFFFWVSESFRVISPSSWNNWAFSFFSLMISPRVG